MSKITVLISLLLVSCFSVVSQNSNVIEIIDVENTAEFISELNTNGKQGFRLLKAEKYPLTAQNQDLEKIRLVGVMRAEKDAVYEYDWFNAFTPHELQNKINAKGADGFRFRKALPFSHKLCGGWPSTTDKNELDITLDRAKAVLEISDGATIIVERKQDTAEKLAYTLATGILGSDKKARDEISTSLNDGIGKGFYPVAMLQFTALNRDAISVLMENGPATEDKARDYEIVMSEFGFEKRVNQLAKNGYRMVFNGNFGAKRYALMKKMGTEPVSYRWVDTAGKKEFRSGIDRILRGSDFVLSAYSTLGCDYVRRELVMMRTVSNRTDAGNSKVIGVSGSHFSLFQEIRSGLSDIKQNTKIELNDLVEQGYEIRDAFFSDGVYLILTKPNTE